MQCHFRAHQPVHIQGEVVEGPFTAELTEYIEALVANGLVEPLLMPVEPTDRPVWELDHCAA